MTGLFGCYSKDVPIENTIDLSKIITEEKYTINNSINDSNCAVYSLDINSDRRYENYQKTNENISVISCGEIFNENISNPKKTILNLYKNNELHHLKDFNGSFAAAIHDNSKEKLILINDRYGSIKIFYFFDNGKFFFSPKIKPLLKIDEKRTLRKDAVIDFFVFGFLLGDKTFFNHIYQLPPASILEISKDGTKNTRYWDYNYDTSYNIESENAIVDELGKLWQNAVERRIKKNEKIFIPLSGGLDSRAILAAALRCTKSENIITFTFGEKYSYDYEIARIIAQKAGVKHILLTPEKNDFEEQYNYSMETVEGMIDATPYFSINGYEKIKKHNGKIISGFMGGEIMGSLILPEMIKLNIKTEKDYETAKYILFNWRKRNTFKDIQQLFNSSYIKDTNIKKSFEETVNDLNEMSDKNFIDYCATWLYKYEEWNYTSFCIFRNKNIFNYLIPFLDNDLVDFILKIPPKYRINKRLYKKMLLKKYPNLFNLPTTNTFGLKLEVNPFRLIIRRALLASKVRINKIINLIIKRDIFDDKLDNYINYNNLLRTNKEYREFIEKKIDKVKNRDYFNKEYIEKLWTLHLNGMKNYATLFGLLTTFELFLENFVDIPKENEKEIIIQKIN